MDYLTMRAIHNSLKVISHPRGCCVKIQKKRAEKIVLRQLEVLRRQKIFFALMRETMGLFLKIQKGLMYSVSRKRHKKEVLKEYWQCILERCKILTNRGLADHIKKFNGHKFHSISMAQRDNLITKCVYIQEIQYIDKLNEWKKAVENLKGENHKKICSRLLKYFMDDYLLNRRSMAEECNIINECIDANIPIPEEKINIQLKKGKTGGRLSKKISAMEAIRGIAGMQGYGGEEKYLKPRSTGRKDIHSISQEKMRESLSHGNDDDESGEGGMDDSDLDFSEEAGIERQSKGSNNLTLKKRISVIHRERIADRVQKANDLDFLNYLQT